MNHKQITLTLATLSIVLFSAAVYAQSETQPSQRGGMKDCCMNKKMHNAGTDSAMTKRMQVMTQTPIFMDSPCAVYGQAATLELSDEQKARLIEIENEARKKALAVLTPEQQEKMGDIPSKPMTMMQMRTKMMDGKDGAMMHKMMMDGEGGQMMMCPMTPMNDGATDGSAGPTTKPAETWNHQP